MPYKNREDQSAYQKAHYKKYKQKYLDQNRVNKAKLRKYVADIKESKPCTDCGISYPHFVMDFDHMSEKIGIIKDFVNRNNKKLLDEEIAKCEIVCSNCHRFRTQYRLQVKMKAQ